MKTWNRETLTLALLIALLPPLWAVLAPTFGVQTGAVALICAGVYVSAGNDRKKAVPMSLGFLAGDAWAVLALWVMSVLPLRLGHRTDGAGPHGPGQSRHHAPPDRGGDARRCLVCGRGAGCGAPEDPGLITAS